MVAHLSSSDYDPSGIVAAFGVFYMFVLLIAAAAWAFMVYLYWRIATKAGYPGAYSLLLLVPIANIVVLALFVFRPWPIELETQALRAQLGFDPSRPSGFGQPAYGGYRPPTGPYPGGPAQPGAQPPPYGAGYPAPGQPGMGRPGEPGAPQDPFRPASG